MSDYETEPEEYLYKILVVGDVGCGKTAIIKRYINNIFSTKYKATVRLVFTLIHSNIWINNGNL